MKRMKIGFIGAGAMGGALCRGILKAGVCSPKDLIAGDPRDEVRAELHERFGLHVTKDNREVIEFSDVVFLAVKPYMVSSALEEISDILQPRHLLISIAAGIRVEAIEQALKEKVPVIRVMPNTPALVGAGASAYAPGAYATAEHLSTAGKLLSAVGLAVQTDEKNLDAVTGLSGSGPAYIYLIIEALTAGGIKTGLPRDIAQKLAAQTVLGAAKMVLETGRHPAELKDAVTTPAGTTIAGLAELEKAGVRAACMAAVEAASNRSKELS
jgi:pyrroline-5-carboxylate reductase